mmetsp:Transcript_2253/g.3756  ORF Transcript_2253/g.3756 Transcript_2253/m.3756 type:complete len:102 (-) Transcript_2253:123-428(-)
MPTRGKLLSRLTGLRWKVVRNAAIGTIVAMGETSGLIREASTGLSTHSTPPPAGGLHLSSTILEDADGHCCGQAPPVGDETSPVYFEPALLVLAEKISDLL